MGVSFSVHVSLGHVFFAFFLVVHIRLIPHSHCKIYPHYACLSNLVREYADSSPQTLKFEAEGADFFYDSTPENLGGSYSERALDVGAFPDDKGWYVGWVESGEWLEYVDVKLGCGTYHITAWVATTRSNAKLRLLVYDKSEGPDTPVLGGHSNPVIPLPNSEDEFFLITAGHLTLQSSRYNFFFAFVLNRTE
jgi:DUF5010 C-terminal domain